MDKAIFQYKKSTEQGNSSAQISLAFIYKNGNGIDNRAIFWYQKAAEQGNQDTQIKLAFIYYQNGNGIDKDMVESNVNQIN